MSEHAPSRVVIEGVAPQVDCGRFAAKAIAGERVEVEADVFTDGHDALAAVLLHRPDGAERWTEVRMAPLVNDRWRGEFQAGEPGVHEFTIEAWVDRVESWRRDLLKKVGAGQDVAVHLLVGRDLALDAARRAPAEDADRLRAWAARLADGRDEDRLLAAQDTEAVDLARQYPDRGSAARLDRVLRVCVEPEIALAGAWYELFPRSTSPEPGRHGTLRDVIARLPRIAAMGFDVLYLPPIHPIGRAHRKGANNALEAGPADPGSPWAIGSSEGGHTAVHPDLGTVEDLRALVDAAARQKIAIALDLAFQAAPDHPFVHEHPEFFRHRPDGSLQHAENPPKKYEDIVPFDFETRAWRALWDELGAITRFWIRQGIRIFRVDNPHTKPFAFWEWLIADVKREHPDVIFLAEAFTRPKVMYRLAKLGFSQSYTYFAWRNTKRELTAYFEQLYRSPVVDFFRPNLWPNTPDILTEYLQTGGRPAFAARLVLAATLGASYGIYGPAFELLAATAREWGSEEYIDSEKYQVQHWNLDRPDSLEPLIARVNQVRRENPALLRNRGLRFHPVDNDQLIAYSKVADPDRGGAVLVVVNLDPHHAQSGWVELPPETFGLDPARSFQVHDMLSGSRFLWQGTRHFVQLDPASMPAHIFRIRRYIRSERDFEYYL